MLRAQAGPLAKWNASASNRTIRVNFSPGQASKAWHSSVPGKMPERKDDNDDYVDFDWLPAAAHLCPLGSEAQW